MTFTWFCKRSLPDGGYPGWRFARWRAARWYAYDLDTLVIQLVSAKKIDSAIDVLGLNIHAHPEHVESYFARAKLYFGKGEAAQAEENLRLARSIRQDR
jgi:hypothetical protein